MTAKEIAKRNQKAEQLRVLQTDDQFYVESGEGKILYAVTLDDDGNTCTCGDYAKNCKKDPNFKCKHILSVMNAIPTGNVENGKFLEKLIPKLDERFPHQHQGKRFRIVCRRSGSRNTERSFKIGGRVDSISHIKKTSMKQSVMQLL